MNDPQLFTRRDFVSTSLKASAAAFTTALLPRFSADAAGQYNVLFIIVDDLRPLLGCYGHPEIHTPNIDRLAQRGTLFNRAYCQYPLCSPSRTAMITGLRPETTGVVNNSDDFRQNLPDVVTLPQNFKTHGYHTQAVGKVTHFGTLHDDEHSWSVPSWRPSSIFFDIKTSPSWQALDVEDDELRDGKTARRAVQVLKQIKQQFFLTVGFYKPHLPFKAPRKYFELYNPQDFDLPASTTPPKDVPDSALTNWDFIRRYQDLPSGEKTLSDKKTLELTLAYAATTSYVDAQIGRLFTQLETLGLTEKTVIAFCGDHGYHLGEHGIWGKKTLFEVTLRSPLIVSIPGQRPTETDTLAELVDIYPTLCDACQLPMPSQLEGVSLMPVIDEPSRPWKTAAFSLLNNGVKGNSIRTEQHRYTEWGNNGRHGQELYDYHADPNETVNIAYLPENKQLVAQLSEQLHAGWQAALPDVSEQAPKPDIRLPTSQRADIYWINTDSGTLHRLVGNSVEDIAPNNAQDVVSLVVTDTRLYWVEKTGGSSGRIRRSNLNGSSIQLIRNLTTAPAGITVDTVNSKIYVTTERGKIQQINIDGSQYQPNLIVGLDTPKDIAVDTGSGKMFWITETGSVHYANVDGSGETQLGSGYGTLGGIAVGAGKVFWTEETGEASGKIHSANVDGSNVQELVSLNAAPYGISVDAAAKKLYWTNSRGKIMHSNLNGNSIRDVVKNLVSLGDVAVPAGATPTRPPGTFSKYDVNRDGTVDNTDAALVADALGESPPSNPRLDVNDDGRVNFLDLLLVFDNRDNTNAAPVAVAKLPKVSREEVQKQINLLLATNNDSLTAQHTLAYLQSLLEVVTPEKTRLLANYPNPFNPETWIPYQLGTSSDVQITIYNAAGRVVRTLTLGHQSEGYYTDRNRAAYWDGRNVIGERVSSGVYFYQLQADIVSSPRKMLILK